MYLRRIEQIKIARNYAELHEIEITSAKILSSAEL